jgi:acetyltransferase-like isoleucine patch superfamily enzyme
METLMTGLSNSPAMTPQQRQFATTTSPLRSYKDRQVGPDSSWAHLAQYEAITTLGSLPGAIGMALRMALYPLLFSSCDSRAAIGTGVTIRNPRSVCLGKRVMLDDYAAVEAKGPNASIILGDYTLVGRFSSVAAKSAQITLERGVNIGSYCRIASQSKIVIGESTLIAAFCYIGPGNHRPSDGETPLIEQDMEIRGGVSIGRHVWIGAHSTILDGVTIGDGAIVGAHSLVRDDVPAGQIVAGVPARAIRETR